MEGNSGLLLGVINLVDQLLIGRAPGTGSWDVVWLSCLTCLPNAVCRSGAVAMDGYTGMFVPLFKGGGPEGVLKLQGDHIPQPT